MRASDGSVGAAVPAVEDVRDGCADDIGVIRTSVAGTVPEYGGFSGGMASCGVRVVSGEGVLKQGVGEAEFVLPGKWAEAMATRIRRSTQSST